MASDDDLARLDAAAALRDLNHAFVAHDRDVDGLRALQQVATREATALRSGPPRTRAASLAAVQQAHRDAPDAAVSIGLEDRAVAGRANPTATVVDIESDDDTVTASVMFGPACIGPPGRVHGGVVCAVFDDVTGFLTSRLEEPAFTGELTVRYLAPVPLNERLTIRAWVEGREGRKRFIREEMANGEQVVATCRATCIVQARPDA